MNTTTDISINSRTAREAADALLKSHAETGSDLSTWPEVLALVVAVYPSLVVEGTGEETAHIVHSKHGETGRYWIDGVQNTDAYLDSDSPWAQEKKNLFLPVPEYAVTGYLDIFGNVYEEDFAMEQAKSIGADTPAAMGWRKVLASDFYQADIDGATIENHPPVIYRYLVD